jgi:hypothetical protein
MWLQFRRSYCWGEGGGAWTADCFSTDRSKHKRDGGSIWVSIRDRVLTDRPTYLM